LIALVRKQHANPFLSANAIAAGHSDWAPDDNTVRLLNGPSATRLAAAAISLISVIAASPSPETSRSLISVACSTAANQLNLPISDFASGLTSRRGSALGKQA
jgi:hypothetical protein